MSKLPTQVRLFDPDLIQQLVRDSRREQGLADQITDQAAIARLVMLLRSR